MSHTVTITLGDEAYRKLREQFGDEPIDQVIENLLRPYTITEADLDEGYKAMAADEEYEAEAREWLEFRPDDGLEDDGDEWAWLRPVS